MVIPATASPMNISPLASATSARAPLGERQHDGCEPFGLLVGDAGRPSARGEGQGVTQPRTEVAHHQRRHLVPRHKRSAAPQQHPPRRHQIWHLLERHLQRPKQPGQQPTSHNIRQLSGVTPSELLGMYLPAWQMQVCKSSRQWLTFNAADALCRERSLLQDPMLDRHAC